MFTILKVSYAVFKSVAIYCNVYFFTRLWNGAADTYKAGCGANNIIYICEVTETADISDFDTTFPSAAEVDMEDDVEASVTIDTFIMTTKYDIQETVTYIGKAKQGTSEASTGWTIQKISFVDGNPTTQQTTAINAAIWNNRATETYL